MRRLLKSPVPRPRAADADSGVQGVEFVNSFMDDFCIAVRIENHGFMDLFFHSVHGKQALFLLKELSILESFS